MGDNFDSLLSMFVKLASVNVNFSFNISMY